MSSQDVPEIGGSAVSDSDPLAVRFNFLNTYARLPERFYARVNPTLVAAPSLVKINVELARYLGLYPDALKSTQGVEILAGNRVAEGSEPTPGQPSDTWTTRRSPSTQTVQRLVSYQRCSIS